MARVVYSELHPPRPALRAVQDGTWKLIREEGRQEALRLFDLRHDPGERHDVAARRPDVVVRLRDRLDTWLTALPPPAERRRVPVEDSSVTGQLRALGYIQ